MDALYFGDGTRGANGQVDIAKYAFTQGGPSLLHEPCDKMKQKVHPTPRATSEVRERSVSLNIPG
jgi:hypothetical protein